MRTSPRGRKLISQAKCYTASRDREQGGKWSRDVEKHHGCASLTSATSCSPLAPCMAIVLQQLKIGLTNWSESAINPCKRIPKKQEIIFCLISKMDRLPGRAPRWEGDYRTRGKEAGQQRTGLSSSLATDQGHQGLIVSGKQKEGKQMESK